MNRLRYILMFALVSVLLLNVAGKAAFSAVHSVEESHVSSSCGADGAHEHAHTSPEDNHDDTGHTHACCEHHTTLYFDGQALIISYAPTVTANGKREPFEAFPEVYLDKFIPPQNA